MPGNKKIRLLIFACVYTLLLNAAFSYVAERWTFATIMNGQECLPWKYWVIVKKERPVAGDFVAFRGEGIPHFDDGIKWVKRIVAGEDGVVHVTPVSKEEREGNPQKYRVTAFFNDMPRTFYIQGYVTVEDKNGLALTSLPVYDKDRFGRPMPMIKEQVIPKGKYFVTATADRSYDSRYWGLLDEKYILGRAFHLD